MDMRPLPGPASETTVQVSLCPPAPGEYLHWLNPNIRQWSQADDWAEKTETLAQEALYRTLRS